MVKLLTQHLFKLTKYGREVNLYWYKDICKCGGLKDKRAPYCRECYLKFHRDLFAKTKRNSLLLKDLKLKKYTLSQLGVKYNISKSKVSQIHKRYIGEKYVREKK